MPAAADAHRHLTTIARVSRPAGGVAESEARRYCAAHLAAHGFDTREAAFEYSAFPGRYATPLLGGFAAAAIALAALLAGAGRGLAALVLLGVSLGMAAGAGAWLARRGVLRLPLLRARSWNLIGERGAPALWLVAHLDSKSQPVPIALRAAGLISLGIVWLVAAALAVAALRGAPVQALAVPVAIAAAVAGLPVILSVVGSRSPGARDNASGVATVLCAVSELPKDLPLGVILTSAEELGLAGARALASMGITPAAAINIDTVDDTGDWSVLHGRPVPVDMSNAIGEAARRRGARVVMRRTVPGILTDGVALADGGWQVVTLSRATLATLTRVHTRSDGAADMTGAGISDGAAIVTDAIAMLHSRGE